MDRLLLSSSSLVEDQKKNIRTYSLIESFTGKWYLEMLIFIVLGVITVLGDDMMRLSFIARDPVWKALVDNGLHSAIAGLSWAIVVMLERQPSLRIAAEVIGCAALGSIIDIDHFAAAGTLSLQGATHGLGNRPPLHCTTPFVALWLSLLILHWFSNSWIPHRLAWAIFLSIGTHHLRDALRHGFWILPWGSTAPVPFTLYVVLTLAFPFITYVALVCTNFQNRVEWPRQKRVI